MNLRIPLTILSLAAGVLAGCNRAETSKPSILLFVYDTTRADAASSYGSVAGTTPEMDALAAAGIRYASAYSNAPWTLPSHTTLFTGLLPREHGVASRAMRASDDLVMLAERMKAAGYETVGFSENEFVSPEFNLTQGFDRFERNSAADEGPTNASDFVAQWLKTRKDDRPFFLFINVMDAHEPYQIRDKNRFVPGDATDGQVRAVNQMVHRQLCDDIGDPTSIDILKGLYLGDVAAADAKLGRVRRALADAGLEKKLISIVTSDHGEHFGEHDLMEHNFSVREAVLHVPLVVSGLPSNRPAVIEEPVQLADVVPSVLSWIGAAPSKELSGRPLPTDPSIAQQARAITAEYTEPSHVASDDKEPSWLKAAREQVDIRRQPCEGKYPVFGDLVSVLRYPYRFLSFESAEPELYDIRADPREQHNLAASQPELVRQLTADVEQLQANRIRQHGVELVQLSDAARERLERLGYLGTPSSESPNR